MALARALTEDGRTGEAASLVRTVWRDDDLNSQLESRLKEEFGSLLTRDDHKYRAERLLYKEQNASALRVAALAGRDVVALVKAHAAVIAESPDEEGIHPAGVTAEQFTKGVLVTCLIGCHQYLVTRAVSHTSPSMR